MLAIACILATYLLSQLSLCSIFVLILVSRSLSVRIAIDNIRRSVPVQAYALQMAGTSLDSTQSTTLNRTAWLIDSGASDHIACELRYFTDWKRLQRPIPIILGNHSSV